MAQPLCVGYEADTAASRQQRAHRLEDAVNGSLIIAGYEYEAVARITRQFIRPAFAAITRTANIGYQGKTGRAQLPQALGQSVRERRFNYDFDPFAGFHSSHLIIA